MGIKSFQGKRSKEVAKKDVQITVGDYMTSKLIVFEPEQSVYYVIDKLIKHKISGGPVVNEKNELIGIISEGDCIKDLSESKYYNMPLDDQHKVKSVMHTDVEIIDKNTNIFDAAKKFLTSKRRRFPIVENGKLIGIISQKDVLKAAISLQGNSWK